MTVSRAAVMEAPGRVAVREFEVPDPGPGAVVMKMSLSGICGTDKHTFRGESKQYAGTPHERDIEYPLICGHESRRGRGSSRPARCGTCPGAACCPVTGSSPARTCRAAAAPTARGTTRSDFCQNLEDYGNSLNCSLASAPVRWLVRVPLPASRAHPSSGCLTACRTRSR